MITNAVSLFDGIGGFPLALGRNGISTVASVEIDAACRGVISRKLPSHISQFSDVMEVDGAALRRAGFDAETGILTAGWPCQGNSVAGRRGGLGDPRSGLWGQVARLLGETRPRWFLGENVPGLLSVNGGRDFGIILESLEQLGYGLAWRVLDAQFFGVPQRRKRVFLVGCLGDGAGPAQVLLEPESLPWDSAASTEPRARVAGTLAASAGGGGLGGVGQSNNAITSRIVEVVSTLQGGGKRGYRIDAEGAAGGHLIAVPFNFHQSSGICAGEDGEPSYTLAAHHGQQVCGVQTQYAVRRLTPLECERLQGFPDGWTDGQSDAARYRQLGNAVAVPVVDWVTRRIVAYDSTSNREAV